MDNLQNPNDPIKRDERLEDECSENERLENLEKDLEKSLERFKEKPEKASAKYSKVTAEDRKNLAHGLGIVLNFAVTAAACVLIGVFFGLFLDRRLGTDPWMVVVFSLLGVLAAFKSMFDMAKKI